jgi:hypothetical protein
MARKGRAFSTREAAKFLVELGVRASVRTLARQRTRLEDDPGKHGPPWYRHEDGRVSYFEADLMAYAAAQHRALTLRGPAEQPARLRRERAA